tara:strand:- start:328 stop:582 length:255 start_codon:yes stop_codon:yes gene_type:complete
MNQQTIELDCAPGGMRPGDLIEGVLVDTPLKLEEHFEKDIPKSFGNWTFIVKEEFTDLYLEHTVSIKEKITNLYTSGYVRYASW